MTVVHLPVYPENPYQPLLMKALANRGLKTIDGGGGGNFLRTALFRWKADVLHFHWLHPYLLRQTWLGTVVRATRFLVEVAILRLSGVRVVWTVHNLANHDRRYPGLERFFSTLFAGLVNGVVVHSNYALKAAENNFRISHRTPKAVVPQGSYVGHYPNSVFRSDARTQLEIPQQEFVFLFLGRVEAYKGVQELIRSFKQLDSGRLLIAGRLGTEQQRGALLEEIGTSRNIDLRLEHIPEGDIQLFCNAADIYVLPAREILNSGSAVLATSFGLPCIAPRIGGLPEALAAQSELLYEPEEPDALLGALRHAIELRAELTKIGKRNLTQATAHSWQDVAERMVAFYRTCVIGGS